MIQNREMTDKFIIRNASLRLDDYVFFICLLIFLYLIIAGHNSEIVVVVFLGLLGFTTYRIIKRLHDRSDKIIIDKKGIKLCDTNDFISWSKINYAYIKQKSEGVGRNSRVVDYFHIDTLDGEIRVRMTDFKFKHDLLVHAIEHFSGRNIGELTDLLRAKTKKIIGNDRDVERISKILTDFYKRQTYLALISIITLVGISFFLQLNIDFPYVFAIGFTLTLGIIYLIGILEEKRFRNQEYINEIDDKKYKALKKEYGQGYDVEMSKGKKIASMVFLILFVLGIFGLSYIFDKEKNKRENKETEKLNSLTDTEIMGKLFVTIFAFAPALMTKL